MSKQRRGAQWEMSADVDFHVGRIDVRAVGEDLGYRTWGPRCIIQDGDGIHRALMIQGRVGGKLWGISAAVRSDIVCSEDTIPLRQLWAMNRVGAG